MGNQLGVGTCCASDEAGKERSGLGCQSACACNDTIPEQAPEERLPKGQKVKALRDDSEGINDEDELLAATLASHDKASSSNENVPEGAHQTATYEDGSSYTGQMVSGKRHGKGIWKSETGQYEGQWRSDQPHGKGRQTWSNGRVYEGEFAYGKFSGFGRMVWQTNGGPMIYEGEYMEDQKHGRGKFLWADGRSYDGEWRNGKRWGQGVHTNTRQEKKVGMWADDKFEGWLQDDSVRAG
eukprot:gnl/TRDRNA2_/TRDRNA2_149349_c1_seq2.p1 gnl/TRDRNA2_/TRDRNA2_149349_c1~~gnl/TRDRNA2_/TRDRNA2_149349_c1_seq2.p1  ORF type:complete len:239 (-),score=42.63 gnl/TRDRNA2_/TRDRNA2_149349_c1_seq2:28-744(-)